MIDTLPIVLDRDALARRETTLLHRGGRGNPDVLWVSGGGEGTRGVVVKDFAPRGPLVKRWLAPRALDREARAYRVLDDLEAVPRLLGRVDSLALVFEYRPGVLLSRSLAGKLPADFLPSLEQTVGLMHGRGFVHLDLRHRSNILAGEDGRPVLLDFASALRLDGRDPLSRALFAIGRHIDRRALDKWRVRLA